jgi:ribonuclease Z
LKRCLILALALTLAAPAQEPPKNLPPPPMQVILLGTGFPRPDPERAGPAAAVVVGEKVFVVDAGRGVVLRLAATEFKLKQVQAVFLTHLHSDHTSGLPDLFTSTWIFGRKTPLELYGPKGTKSAAKALLEYFKEDIHIRRDLTEMHPAEGAKINAHEIHEGVVYQDADVTITAFAVDHRPVEPAFGYASIRAARASSSPATPAPARTSSATPRVWTCSCTRSICPSTSTRWIPRRSPPG